MMGDMGKDAEQMFNATRSYLDQEWTAAADWLDGLAVEELVNAWSVLTADTVSGHEFRVLVLGMPDSGCEIARRLLKTALCEAAHRVQERERIAKEDSDA